MELMGMLVTADIWLNTMPDVNKLMEISEKSIISSNMNIVEKFKHSFNPQGESLVYVLAESHFSIHCVSVDTEILTEKGWKFYNEIIPQDKILTYNLVKDELEFQIPVYLYVGEYKGIMYNMKNCYIDALFSPDHNCLVQTQLYKGISNWHLRKAEELPKSYIRHKISSFHPITEEKFSDDYLKLLCWIITEGYFRKDCNGIGISQSNTANPKYVKEIDNILLKLEVPFSRSMRRETEEIEWYIKEPYSIKIRQDIPDKEFPINLAFLSNRQSEIALKTLIKGDGSFRRTDLHFTQKRKQVVDLMQILGIRNNYRSYLRHLDERYAISFKKKNYTVSLKKDNNTIDYSGLIFCPRVANGTWIARRNNKVFITGNSYPEKKYISVDCYTCGLEGNPKACINSLLLSLDVNHVKMNVIKRGIY